MNTTHLDKLLEFKLTLDEEYESQCEENAAHDSDVFNVHNIDQEDLKKLDDLISPIHDAIMESYKLGDYMAEGDRDDYWEIYLSTSGHGAGFFDHGTEEGDAIQAFLDKRFRYALDDLHFSQGDDGKLHMSL